MVPAITPTEANAWVHACHEAGQQPVLLDVREGWELQLASLRLANADFIHTPMQQVPAQVASGDLDPQRPVLVMCHHGVRSMHVARFLQAQGFARVFNLAGGIDAWSTSVDPKVPVY